MLKISKSIKLWVKMKNVSFTLWKKINELLGLPNTIRKQKVRRGGEMQIKTMKAGLFSPRRLAEIE